MIIRTDTQIHIKAIESGAGSTRVKSVSSETTLKAKDLQMGGGSIVPYTGAYTFTPTTSTQTIEIDGKTASQDITINPIPSNYGLITWNGSTLTVS